MSTTFVAAVLIAAPTRRAAGRTAAAAAPTAAPTAPAAATPRPLDFAELRLVELLRRFEPPLLFRAPPAPERLLPERLLPPLLFFALEPPLFRPPEEALPPLRPAAARFAEVDDLELLPDDERPLLLPPEALPPLRPAAARFADVEPDDLLLPPREPPPEALPPLRPAAARFAEVELFEDDFEADFEDFDDLEDFDDFELLDDDFAPPLLDEPPLFFAPFDALFFAAMLFLLFQKVFGGEPYF